MLSGLVYFEEIVENVKDLTGIQNMRPLYDKIRRFVFNSERQIGAGGLIIRKKKIMTTGDGFYDGKTIIMPTDFIGEYSYGDLSAGVLNGNILTLNCDGPAEIELYYMGFLLDNNGNPITTRNHMDAVIAHCLWRLYSPRVFLGEGNANLLKMYEQDYNDEVLSARGQDAFPTEEEWQEIGRTLNGGAFEAFTNCGLASITNGCNETFFLDGGLAPEEIPALDCDCDFVEIFEASLVDSPPEGGDAVFLGEINTSSVLTGILTTV